MRDKVEVNFQEILSKKIKKFKETYINKEVLLLLLP